MATIERLITIDGGTSNTRGTLWADGTALQTAVRPVGVRDTAVDGHNGKLQTAVHAVLEELLDGAGCPWEGLDGIYASGMITSDMGLVEVPHLTAPVGIRDLAAGIREALLPAVATLPICFIPGVRNLAGTIGIDQLEAMDMMRGEEVEAFALLERLTPGHAYLLVLPGSHTKFVSVDAESRITGCLSSLAGELLQAVTMHTILADAVGGRFVDATAYDRDWLLRGFRTAQEVGMSRAAFSTRILSRFVDRDPMASANFLLGAVLEEDVRAVRHSGALRISDETHVVIAGKEPFRSGLLDVLSKDGGFASVEAVEVGGEASLAARGALAVARLHRLGG